MLSFDCVIFEALQKIEDKGYEAYLVGGIVRDRIMGKSSSDVDITTSASPENIKDIFSEYNVIETGILHGTVTVIYKGIPMEITTYRKETSYTDNRHPDSVSYCKDIKEDLKRRDFTVNALCLDKNGNLLDCFGGLADIEKKIIKAIGNPCERFSEDALRILRALRFSSVLGFEIEKETAAAIHKCKNLISNVANERIAAEIKKLLIGDNVRQVLIEYSDVITLILPEMKDCVNFNQHNFHHKYDVYTHIAHTVENAPKTEYMRLAALFHDCAKPMCFSLDSDGVGHFYSHASLSSKKAQEALKRLRFDNSTVNAVTLLVKQHDGYIDEDERLVMKKLNRFGEKTLRDLIKLQKADTLALADEFVSRLSHFESLNKIIDGIIESQKCFSLKNLAVNGNDIKTLGYKGREIGSILNFLVDSVIENKVENNKEKLLCFLKKTIDNGFKP